MTPTEQEYHDHLQTRPELPRPYDPESKAARAHQKALQAWVDRKERLECALVAEHHPVACDRLTPTAGVQPQKPHRPAPCATREYNAQKARESGARQKERNQAAAREVLAERVVRIGEDVA